MHFPSNHRVPLCDFYLVLFFFCFDGVKDISLELFFRSFTHRLFVNVEVLQTWVLRLLYASLRVVPDLLLGILVYNLTPLFELSLGQLVFPQFLCMLFPSFLEVGECFDEIMLKVVRLKFVGSNNL